MLRDSLAFPSIGEVGSGYRKAQPERGSTILEWFDGKGERAGNEKEKLFVSDVSAFMQLQDHL